MSATPLPRITRASALMSGKPRTRGVRVTVGMIPGSLGGGVAAGELLDASPHIEREDAPGAIRYGACSP